MDFAGKQHARKHTVTSTNDHDVSGFTAYNLLRVNSGVTALEEFAFLPPDGFGQNYKISASVAANDLIFTLTDANGNTPSATSPAQFMINGTTRSCTASTTKTLADGTGWFGSGASELATFRVDYFTYAVWNTTPSTDRIDIVASRIPFARTWADFSSTSTNEKYAAFSGSDTPNSTDDVILIGRFSATLSAGAGFTWSISGTGNVYNRPIYESDWSTWQPTYTGFSANPSGTYRYKIVHDRIMFIYRDTVNGTSNATSYTGTLPFTNVTDTSFTPVSNYSVVDNGSSQATPGRGTVGDNANTISFALNWAGTGFTNSGNKRVFGGVDSYRIK
jgi:hypothetical protein